MKLGVPKEPEGETRVGIVPSSMKKLTRAGFEVYIEAGAGLAANYADQAYTDAGAHVVSRAEALACENIVCIRFPGVDGIGSGTNLACVSDPFRHPEYVKACMDAKITLLSMDMIPRRLSRAQSMDVNSSQDNLAGYKAVLLGAAQVPKGIPMMTTSAGTIRPAKVVIMGSGVAGLQAIATAKRLGAIVFASDVRKSAAEQIESVGGRFIEVDGMDDFEDESGYAKPLTPEFIQKVNDTVCGVAADADIIVTTARIFGRPAPITVPSSAVANFKSGAVVVDMNADVGGNCEDTVQGEIVTTDNGVIIVGTSNLPGTLANTASMLYSNNLTTFFTSLVDKESGDVVISDDDDILVGAPEGSDFYVNGMGGVLICKEGAIHPKQTRLAGVVE
ncbi:MAG: NAD(P) transhydrogenase subunit alpha [Candidatus Thermoplasmatota archaeon]|jgi:NAD(P) transhydrogenase subunit alpha|nr:NAD(P) transhydrogenase subunit alpha [Candidatus Thermoplasmatota archaeon]MEC8576702.1 NAD(P) transhydrogenase subunit alpha [Candidatus Thermoplasmatota archaeon]MEC9194859.1 NAD(P) transhydrogenase subunit alpha [Candidatus Thermoplasmatota archaeon]MED6319230.1 NAD(P) transhydrogenase subunit alpha [Candidatus Thermoplasmatota archaeon]MEE3084318.1 NAD(P) transhydrogenase subunit alpha [Candidatus Thermoplasmatota archaeon]